MINLGLKRTARLLQHIATDVFQQPHFQPPWKAAHIAGTNGKGSVAAYLSALLRRASSSQDDGSAQPLRVGRFTSPHFIDRWDCIQIDDRPVAKDVFLRMENRVKALAVRVEEELSEEAQSGDGEQEGHSADVTRRDARPTEFEILTATAFALFSESSPRPCDFAVIECGMGGRLDATNTLPDSAILVSLITRIGLDHVSMLGGSLESIIREKCGIVRAGVRVVVDGGNDESVLRMIRDECEQRLGLEQLGALFFEIHGDNDPEIAKLQNKRALMAHQQANLALALKGCQVLRSEMSYLPVSSSPAVLIEALDDASKSYPARLQWLCPGWLDGVPGSSNFSDLNKAWVLLDGAHNEQSAGVLRQFVEKHLATTNSKTRNIIWILALSSTKPPAEILTTLLRGDQQGSPESHQRVILTQFGPIDGMPWVKPTPTTILESNVEALGLNHMLEASTNNILEALQHVEQTLLHSNMTHERPLVVIAGSLYLASDMLRLCRDGTDQFLRYWQTREEETPTG